MAVSKKKQKVEVNSGVFHITSTSNNTIICVTDLIGKVLCWASAGSENQWGRAKKKTPLAAQIAAKAAALKAQSFNMKNAQVIFKGFGSGRENCIQPILNSGILVSQILDRTPLPHNGCRPPKKRKL